jgi:predicted homoserine dehydrogenase-like protein
LCAFEAPLTAAEAVLYGTATATPAGDPVADVATFAKRDLAAGEPLEGIGGEKHYGLIVNAEQLRAEGSLPVGIAEYATLRRAVRKDEMIRHDDVVLDEAQLAVQLRRKVEEVRSPAR